MLSNKISISSRTMDLIKSWPVGHEFTSTRVGELLKEKASGAVSGFLSRAKELGLIEIVRQTPNIGNRKTYVYRVKDHNAKIGTRIHPFIKADGSMGGKPGRKMGPREDVVNMAEVTTRSIADTTLPAARTVEATNKNLLSDQLLTLAAHVAELEYRKPNLEQFTSSELLAELGRRHGA